MSQKNIYGGRLEDYGLHGHPRELFVPMVLTFSWAVFAVASSYRLYHIRVGTFRVLGVSQFVESVGMVLLVMFGYAHACYFFIMGILFGIHEPNQSVKRMTAGGCHLPYRTRWAAAIAHFWRWM